MLNKDTYNLTQTVQGAIFQGAFNAYQASLSEDAKNNQPSPHPLMQIKRGYAESPAWMMIQAKEFDPEPLTVEKLVIRATYSAPSLIQAILELLASEGWLDKQGNYYSLTDAGHNILQNMDNRRRAILADYEPLPQNDLERMARLFRRVIDESFVCQGLPSQWCLIYSRRRAPDESASVLEHLVQYCGDMNALRDDAHMSAFWKYNVIGYTWEAFTYITNEQAQNAEDLVKQIGYRGFSRQEWHDSLEQLVIRGWLELDNNIYRVTSRGIAIREDVEQQTDQYFYAPWSCLSNGEIEELRELMTRIIESTQ